MNTYVMAIGKLVDNKIVITKTLENKEEDGQNK